MTPYAAPEIEPDLCPTCGRPVLPMGIYAMPIDGFCACIFQRA